MSNDSSKNFIKNKLKSHLPKDWLTELRIIYCIALETINGIKRTGLVNIAIITTMAITLTVFCILLSCIRYPVKYNTGSPLKQGVYTIFLFNSPKRYGDGRQRFEDFLK